MKKLYFYLFYLFLIVKLYSNIDLPERVFFRTANESFNQRYYFKLINGKLWIKEHNDFTNESGAWILLGNKNNAYFKFDYIEKISVDGRQIEIVYKNKLYTSMNGLDHYSKWKWWDKWGSPLDYGPGIFLPSKYRAFSISFSDPEMQRYQIDNNGNKFKVFVGTLYLLSEDGTEIHFTDPWTPADWGYQFIGPERGRFISENLSASGSMIFVINKYGDMFTKYIDFDVMGGNPTLFYTYEKIPVHEGLFDRRYPRKLPIADWYKQPKINGSITKKISVYSNGEGDRSRILRVEGSDKSGDTGYYEKSVYDKKWVFIKTNEKIDKKDLIENTVKDYSNKDLGPSKDFNYSAELKDCYIQLENFNLFGSPCNFKITLKNGNAYNLILHTVIGCRFTVNENPGYNGTPLKLKGAIEIPQNLLNLKDKKLNFFLKNNFDFSYSNKSRFINVKVSAAYNKVTIKKDSFFSFLSKLKLELYDNKNNYSLSSEYFKKYFIKDKTVAIQVNKKEIYKFRIQNINVKEELIDLAIEDGKSLPEVLITLKLLNLEEEIINRNKLNIFEYFYEIFTGKSSKKALKDNPVEHEVMLSIKNNSENNAIKKIFETKKSKFILLNHGL